MRHRECIADRTEFLEDRYIVGNGLDVDEKEKVKGVLGQEWV